MYAPVYYKQDRTLFEKLNFLLFLSPRWLTGCYLKYAEVAELVDAHDSKSCISRCVGSIPTFGTQKGPQLLEALFYFINKNGLNARKAM